MMTDKMSGHREGHVFAAFERGRVYSANIVNQIKKIEHVLESEYFYSEKKINSIIRIGFLEKINENRLFSRFQVYIPP